MKYKFQRENGYLFEGNLEIAIRNHVAEIEEKDITPAMQLVINANGGQEIVAEKPTKRERKVNPIEWTEEKATNEVTDLLKKVKEKNEAKK